MPVGTIQAQLDASHSLSSTRKSSAALLSGKNNVDVSMLSTVKSNRQHCYAGMSILMDNKKKLSN